MNALVTLFGPNLDIPLQTLSIQIRGANVMVNIHSQSMIALEMESVVVMEVVLTKSRGAILM